MNFSGCPGANEQCCCLSTATWTKATRIQILPPFWGTKTCPDLPVHVKHERMEGPRVRGTLETRVTTPVKEIASSMGVDHAP